MFLTPTDEHEIDKTIKSLKNCKSAGPDNINVNILKTLSTKLSPVLTFNFNLCMERGHFPSIFKIASIVPIYKSGSKTCVSNYRPISLLSHLSKILEYLISTRIKSFLQSNNILSDRQYGFTKNKCAEDAVAYLSQLVNGSFNSSQPCTATFLDLAKAFDTVDHDLLLKKLSIYGVRGVAWKLIESYLKNRKQYVVIQNTHSQMTFVQHGVPQGSVLGPLLFLVYINDLLKIKLRGQIISYADDTVLFSQASTWTEVKANMEEDVTLIRNWLDLNKLSLNLKKSNFIAFSINKTKQPTNLENITAHSYTCCKNKQCACPEISKVENTKYLGVIFDSHLRWDSHIQQTVSRVRRTMYVFRKLRDCLPEKNLKMFYYALVSSILNYGLLSYGSAAGVYMKRLEVAQKCIIKIYLKKQLTYPSIALFQDANLLTIKQLYLLKLMKCIHSNSTILIPISHDYTTRSKSTNKVVTQKLNNSAAQQHFTYRALKFYNSFIGYLTTSNTFIHPTTSKKFLNCAKKWISTLTEYEINNILTS